MLPLCCPMAKSSQESTPNKSHQTADPLAKIRPACPYKVFPGEAKPQLSAGAAALQP